MQALPKKILVPTDFSEPSRAALQQAALVANACSAKLTVLYADPFVPPLDPLDDVTTRTARSKEEAARHLGEEVKELVPPNVQVETMVVVNTPVSAILDVAKEKDVDWIVMGTHGRTGVKRLVLGSVTEEVLRGTDRPVLTVRA